LQGFLSWLYQVYSSRDAFDYDFYKVLGGLNMGSGVDWGSDRLTGYLSEQDLQWCQELQRQVREAVEEMWDRDAVFPLPDYPTYLVFHSEGNGVFLHFGHKPEGEPTPKRLTDMLLLRLADILLRGINAEALVRCAECHHCTVRSHPRGKIYCSPVCRVRASITARRRTLQAAKTQKKRIRKEA
jgi:hypothetical protein